MRFVRTLPLTLLLAVPAVAQEKHQLRLNFAPGTTMHYVMSQDVDMKMNMGAGDMGTKMTMKMFMSNAVKGVKGNTATIEQQLTRIVAKADSPMMKVDYDSSDEDSDPGMLESMADMVGQKTTLNLTDQGKIGNIEMDEQAADRAKRAGVNMKDALSNSIMQLPENPVAIGETWETTQSLPMGQGGKINAKSVNELVAVDDKFFTVKTKMVIDLDSAEMPPGGEIQKFEGAGVSKIDRRTGMPAELDMTMKMKMVMGGQMTTEMTMKQSIRPTPAPAKAAKDTVKAGK